jgi:cell division protein FtsQ
MTMMDSRVAERRRGVSEDKARRRLRWILGVLVAVLVVVGSFWLIRSPVLSIRSVEITGAVRTDPLAAIAALGMGVGTPTIDVDDGAIASAIGADPWVDDVSVSVLWPGTLVVDVVEHVPFVAVQSADGWVWASVDGAIVEEAPAPAAGQSVVAIDLGATTVGETTADRRILGGITFLAALPDDLAADAVITAVDDTVWAVVAGHDVRLGRPVDMETKAAVLTQLIASGIDADASIDLIAPLRPAVGNPRPQQEVEE